MTVTQVPTRNGNYIEINGVRTYYEISGDGQPLVLLHGGMCTAETFDAQTTVLAEHYRVIVPERYGHGRTADVDGPITYENMAQHTIGLIDALGIESADLAGWSDGALVALLVALRRPKLVRKLVLIDQYVCLSGAADGYEAFMERLTVDTAPPMLREMYSALSPDGPEHFPVVFDKLHAAWTAETGIDVSDLGNVAAPTLVLYGDDGGVMLEHAADVYRALPDAQLAIVPGTSHGLPIEKPHIVNELIIDFLADEQAPKLFTLDDVEHANS
jgi:pimeloyl-ACP methyl ester carboxylesterase